MKFKNEETRCNHKNSFDNILVPESDLASNDANKDTQSDKTYSSFGDFLSEYSMRQWGYTEPHNVYPWTNQTS